MIVFLKEASVDNVPDKLSGCCCFYLAFWKIKQVQKI